MQGEMSRQTGSWTRSFRAERDLRETKGSTESFGINKEEAEKRLKAAQPLLREYLERLAVDPLEARKNSGRGAFAEGDAQLAEQIQEWLKEFEGSPRRRTWKRWRRCSMAVPRFAGGHGGDQKEKFPPLPARRSERELALKEKLT
jgi:hypothetical protein